MRASSIMICTQMTSTLCPTHAQACTQNESVCMTRANEDISTLRAPLKTVVPWKPGGGHSEQWQQSKKVRACACVRGCMCVGIPPLAHTGKHTAESCTPDQPTVAQHTAHKQREQCHQPSMKTLHLPKPPPLFFFPTHSLPHPARHSSLYYHSAHSSLSILNFFLPPHATPPSRCTRNSRPNTCLRIKPTSYFSPAPLTQGVTHTHTNLSLPPPVRPHAPCARMLTHAVCVCSHAHTCSRNMLTQLALTHTAQTDHTAQLRPVSQCSSESSHSSAQKPMPPCIPPMPPIAGGIPGMPAPG